MAAIAHFEPTAAERAAFGVLPELDLASWVRRHLHVTEGPLVADAGGTPLPYDPDAYPLQRAVMDALDDPRWLGVVLVTSPQAFGKTLSAALPPLLHGLHQRRCDVMYVGARFETAKAVWHRKILPAIEADGELAELIHENPDLGGTAASRRFTNGTACHFAGADSPASLSTYTCPVVVFDDVHAYPAALPGGLGHAADYGARRSEAYAASEVRHVWIGQCPPADSWLWRKLAASAFFAPFLPCPHCGTYQLLEWDRMTWEGDDAVAARQSTNMRCAADCGEPIRFDQLERMLPEVKWASPGPEADWVRQPAAGGTLLPEDAAVYPDTERNTNLAGFWASALYWPHGRTWGERAAEYLELRGAPDRLIEFRQNILVVPHEPAEVDEEQLSVDELEQHAADSGYMAGTLPDWVDLVTLTCDVQSGYVYWLARGWRLIDGESCLVELGTCGKPLRGEYEDDRARQAARAAGITGGLDEVAAKGTAGWPGSGGELRRAAAGLVDRGYEPDVVAGWWALKGVGQHWYMIKGASAGTRGSLWPRKPSLDRRRRPFRLVDVNQAKHVLRRLLRIPAGQAGYWHMPAGGLHANTTRAYYRHLTSERFNRQRRVPCWEPLQPGVANHWLDCEAYQICAAVACGVQLLGFAAPAPAARERKAPRPGTRRPAVRKLSPRGPVRRRY